MQHQRGIARPAAPAAQTTQEITHPAPGLPWTVWDDSVHAAAGQADRMRRAAEEGIQVTELPGGGWLASGASGSAYHVSFDGCDCADFSRRHIPCKHMYALAMEIAGFDPTPYLTSAPSSLARWQDAVYYLEQMTDEDQQTVQQLLYQSLYHPESKPLIVDATQRPGLIVCPLLDHVPLTVLEKLGRMTKDGIFALAAESAVDTIPSKSIKKADLVAWAAESVPDISARLPGLEVVTFARPESGRRKLYSYLLRKYDIDLVYDHRRDVDVSAPHGARYEFRVGWVLPDDDISQLLRLYGHDRTGELAELNGQQNKKIPRRCWRTSGG